MYANDDFKVYDAGRDDRTLWIAFFLRNSNIGDIKEEFETKRDFDY